MGVLDAFEDRELAPRSHVDLELPDAVDDVVVDALGVLPVVFAARLPVAFENVARIVREGTPELGTVRSADRAGERRPRCREDEHTGEKPERSGGRRPHHGPSFSQNNTT